MRRIKTDFNTKTAVALFGTLFLLFYLFSPINHYLAKTIREGAWYCFSIPLLLGMILAMRCMKEKVFRVLLAYWGWILFTRMLNGDPTLSGSYSIILDLCLMLLLFAPGLLHKTDQRWKSFLVIAWIIVLFYFVLGCLSVYSASTDRFLLNPIDEYGIGYVSPYYEGRIEILSMQPNVAAGEFLIAFCFLIILFFQYRSVPIRILFFMAAIVDATVIALTLSRNGQTFFCAALGFTAAFAVFRRVKSRKKLIRILSFAAILAVVTLLSYQMFEPLRYGVWRLRENTAVQERVIETGNPVQASLAQNNGIEEYQADNRGYFESGRKDIFRSALKSLETEPKRLLIGSSYEHKMDISHEMIREWAHHFHNMFLEIINLFGVPGLLLVLYFYWLMLKKIWRMTCRKEADGIFDFPKQLLFVPVLVISGYYMLEAGLFTAMDYRSAAFFYVCGVLSGIEEEGNDLTGNAGLEEC